MSDKIKPHHLGRKMILYVRQSSAHQVMHNQESRILQYAMRDRLHELGWREIEVIDDDLVAIRRLVPSHVPASIAWWPRSVLARSGRWRPGKSRVSPATAGTGSRSG
jgi:hypothetical protein